MNCKKQLKCENFAILSVNSFPKKIRQLRKMMYLRELSFRPVSTVYGMTTPLPKKLSLSVSRCFLRIQGSNYTPVFAGGNPLSKVYLMDFSSLVNWPIRFLESSPSADPIYIWNFMPS